MNTVPSNGLAARHARRVTGVLMLLASLFLMYTLGCHGEADDRAHSTMVGMPSDVLTPGPDIISASVAASDHLVLDVRAVASTELSALTAGGGMDMPLLGLCLTLLVAAVAALAKLLDRSPAPVTLWRRPCPTPVWFLDRDPIPPSLIDLSIQRC